MVEIEKSSDLVFNEWFERAKDEAEYSGETIRKVHRDYFKKKFLDGISPIEAVKDFIEDLKQ